MNVTIPASVTPPFFAEMVWLVVAAAAIAYVCYRLRLLPIIGFLVAGIVIGPNALGLVRNQEVVDAAAELGVILLLFIIGIEFKLEKLARIKRLIFLGGGLQVGLATLATMGLLSATGVGWRDALFSGLLVALSSTAIVLKLLGDRGESNSMPGQTALGLLIFQDLAVVAVVLLVPMLGGGGGSAVDLAVELAKAVALVTVVLLVARRIMPRVLEVVARTCSPELFLLTVVAICFGTAYLTSLAGVSLSLGAFLAGLVVSESRFSEHAMGEILPLQILFSATFFVSVGMLLDVAFLAANLVLVLAVVVAVLVIKLATTAASVAALGAGRQAAIAAAFLLAQIGEFSFVLERTGREAGLAFAGMGEGGTQAFIAATVILMILTPFLADGGARAARGLERGSSARAADQSVALDEHAVSRLRDHVIVAGYGHAARPLVRVLRGSGIPFVVTTLSPGGAAEAEGEGIPVILGDASRQHVLALARVEQAKLLVVADDEPAMAGRIAAVARPLNPTMRITVRTRYTSEVESLLHAGVDRVVSEELESIVALLGDLLRDYQLAEEEIARHEAAVRSDGYAALRDLDPQAPPVVVCRFDDDCFATRSGGGAAAATGTISCKHLSETRAVRARTDGCEECLAAGETWVHLRLCLTCGHVGCCDTSKNRHASRHHEATSHPIVRSLEPGETWAWCFVDEAYVAR
jgi:CPA2 family monovalent cation:H+ antiporter-2